MRVTSRHSRSLLILSLCALLSLAPGGGEEAPVPPQQNTPQESAARAPESQKGIDQLDAVLQRAGSLDAFLSSAEHREAYRKALAQYWGKKEIDTLPYNAILEEIERISRVSPEFARRSWSQGTQAPRSIQIVGEVQSYGRDIDEWEWNRLRENLIQDLQEESKLLLRTVAYGDLKSSIEREFADLAERIASLRSSEAYVLGSKKQKQRLEREFIQSLTANKRLQSAISTLWLTLIETAEIEYLLKSNDPDLILNLFESWSRLGERSLNPFSEKFKIPSTVLSYINKRMPRPSVLVSSGRDGEVFPQRLVVDSEGRQIPAPQGQSKVIWLHPIPRRIHAFFDGIRFGECLGGECTNLSVLTAERFAVSTLESVETYVIEQDSGSLGHVKLVKGRVGGVSLTGLDLVSRSLGLRLRLSGEQQTRVSLFQAIVTQFNQRVKAGELAPLSISNSKEPKNSGAYTVAQADVQFVIPDRVVKGKFIHADSPFAKDLVTHAESAGEDYVGNLVTNASIRDARSHRVFSVTPASEQIERKLLPLLQKNPIDPEGLRILGELREWNDALWEVIPDLLKRAKPSQKIQILEALQHQPLWKLEVIPSVLRIVGSAPRYEFTDLSEKAGLALLHARNSVESILPYVRGREILELIILAARTDTRSARKWLQWYASHFPDPASLAEVGMRAEGFVGLSSGVATMIHSFRNYHYAQEVVQTLKSMRDVSHPSKNHGLDIARYYFPFIENEEADAKAARSRQRVWLRAVARRDGAYPARVLLALIEQNFDVQTEQHWKSTLMQIETEMKEGKSRTLEKTWGSLRNVTNEHPLEDLLIRYLRSEDPVKRDIAYQFTLSPNIWSVRLREAARDAFQIETQFSSSLRKWQAVSTLTEKELESYEIDGLREVIHRPAAASRSSADEVARSVAMVRLASHPQATEADFLEMLLPEQLQSVYRTESISEFLRALGSRGSLSPQVIQSVFNQVVAAAVSKLNVDLAHFAMTNLPLFEGDQFDETRYREWVKKGVDHFRKEYEKRHGALSDEVIQQRLRDSLGSVEPYFPARVRKRKEILEGQASLFNCMVEQNADLIKKYRNLLEAAE